MGCEFEVPQVPYSNIYHFSLTRVAVTGYDTGVVLNMSRALSSGVRSMKHLVIVSPVALGFVLVLVTSAIPGCNNPPVILCGNGVLDGSEECDNPGDPLCLACCELSSGTCLTDNECPNGAYCDQASGSGICNSCGPGCAPFSSCGPLQTCTIGGVCAPEQCAVDSDCATLGPNLVCIDNRCLPSPLCSAADPATCSIGLCPLSLVCEADAGTGVCGCQPLACDQAPVANCASGSCPAGESCVLDAALGSCACSGPVACNVADPADCAAGSCAAGTLCTLDAILARCTCGVLTSAAFQYGVSPNPSYSVGFGLVGQSGKHELTFDVATGELETFQAVLTYPPEFGFNGFLTRGPAGTTVGSVTLDFNFDGTPETSIPVVSLSDTGAYADLNQDGAYTAFVDPSIEHSGAHVLTTLLPRGGDGDVSTIVAAANVRMGLVLLTGVFTNPAATGPYSVNGSFMSVDPNTDGFDDSANDAPLTFSTNLNVDIVEISDIPAASDWGLILLAIVIATLGTIVIRRRRSEAG